VNERVVAPAAAAGVVLPVALATIDNLPVGVMHDDGMYVVLAKALATGQGYHWINVPGAPAATHYPPGYPAVLAAVWKIFPDFPANVMAFKALNALLLAGVAAAIVVFMQRILGLSSRAALLTSIVGCLAIPTLVLSTVVMSEMLFLALLVPTLIYADTLLQREEDKKTSALLGALCGALLLVRTHGIAILAAVVLALLLAKRARSAAIAGGIAVAMVLPWQLWQAAHRGVVAGPMRGDYESYGTWLTSGAGQHPFQFIGRTIAATTRELFATFAATTATGLPTFALRLVAAVGAIAFLFVGIAALRHRARVTMWFVAAYLGIVVLWPFTPGRFLWGIWPLVVALFVYGVVVLLRTRARLGVAALALLVCAGSAVYTYRGYRGRWWSSIGRQTASVAVPTIIWAGEHTRPDDVISTNAELMVYLYTGRHAVPATSFSVNDFFALPTAQSRRDALRSILQAYRIDVVAIIANDSLEAAARRMAAEEPPALSLVDSVPHGLIFSSRRALTAR
jgi:4-amino-4-deoxy-L-arabinose transferase-like glycosyltransferase